MNADLRQLISYVPQGNSMIYGTIAENMRMVREDATDEQIIECGHQDERLWGVFTVVKEFADSCNSVNEHHQDDEDQKSRPELIRWKLRPAAENGIDDRGHHEHIDKEPTC